MAVCGVRARWGAGGRGGYADRDGQAQRPRSASLARRCAGPNRRPPDHRSRRAPALELAVSRRCRGRLSVQLNKVHHVFTIVRVAEMLDEDEGWLWNIAADMEPQHRVVLA